MFKRVDKRRRKKEEEQKLGLDEEVKEIFGIQDTDSEESDSDSDPGGGEEELEEENSGADGEIDPGEDEDDAEEDPSITVSQALKDPLYVVSVLPDVKACIVCPGKLLKTVKMVQLHRTSNAHTRRFKQFSDSSADANPNDNAWHILNRSSETKPKLSLTTSGVSKRAEKKKASQARRKARREEAKEKAKAKKTKAASENASTQPHESVKPKSPPKKKRKIDMEQGLPPAKKSTKSASSVPPLATKKRDKKESANIKLTPVTVPAATATTIALEDDDGAREPQNTTVNIQDIVKSTSSRAKTARSRALSISKKHKVSD